MKRTDHIFALTTSLLHTPDTDFSRLFSIAEQTYTLNLPRKPGVVSLGAYEDNVEETFSNWLARLRKETILRVTVSHQTTEEGASMQQHVAAAFAGHNDFLLQITTLLQTYTYTLDTFFAPRYAISTEQFIFLLNSQQDKEMAWGKVAEQILESNSMNNRSVFPPAETPAYLKTNEGGHVFEYLVSELIAELQIECVVNKQSFVIPEALQSLFIKYESSFLPADDREHVYLYPLRNVTADELLELVNVQPFGLAIWEQLNRKLEEYNESPTVVVAHDEWSTKLKGMSTEDLERIAHPLCRAICDLCETNGTKPIIPSSLATAFGPDEKDQKRAAARSQNKDRWMLQSNENPWEYYAFRKLDYPVTETSKSYYDTQEVFVSALQQIQQFAASIHSPFESAFTLSLLILQTSTPANSDSKTQVEFIVTQMIQAGMEERAIENLRNAEWVIEFGQSMTWEPQRINGLLAVKFADVFGGMGSWNDQYEEMNQEQFQQVSANLFEAMKQHLAAVLSW